MFDRVITRCSLKWSKKITSVAFTFPINHTARPIQHIFVELFNAIFFVFADVSFA